MEGRLAAQPSPRVMYGHRGGVIRFLQPGPPAMAELAFTLPSLVVPTSGPVFVGREMTVCWSVDTPALPGALLTVELDVALTLSSGRPPQRVQLRPPGPGGGGGPLLGGPRDRGGAVRLPLAPAGTALVVRLINEEPNQLRVFVDVTWSVTADTVATVPPRILPSPDELPRPLAEGEGEALLAALGEQALGGTG